MKIRTKITLWISGTALLSTFAFSAVVFSRLVAQPFQLIDREIGTMAEALFRQMAASPDLTGPFDLSPMPFPPDAYWITAKDNRGKTVYRSGLTRYTNLASPGDKSHYLIEKHIPSSEINMGQDAHEDVMFRVLVIKETIRGTPVEIRIGKPIEGLEEDLIRLATQIGISLLLFVLIISWLSYVLAGRILKPIQSIIRNSREINDTSLDRRIPLPKSRDELHALSVSLNTMFDRLENAFDQQKEFIRNASHELKSPVTLLMLAQEDMLMNEDLAPAPIKSLERQLDTTRRMSLLIKNLLDLSRMQQQEKPNLERIDLSDLMAGVLDDYAEVLAERKIFVKNDLPPSCPVQADREKIFRLFVNLIDNAIRYNIKTGGTIRISEKNTAAHTRILISNTGPAIPEADLPRLFENFYRVEKSRSQSLGGSGLGLAIAKKIISLHKGKICISNGADGMITVTLCLPECLPKAQ